MSRAYGVQRRRGLLWLARSAWVLVVATLLVHAVPGLGFSPPGSVGGPSQLFVVIAFILFVLTFATVGALVASRVPAIRSAGCCSARRLRIPSRGGPARYIAIADLTGQPLYNAGLALGFLTLLLFPTGSLPSRRWRWAGWLIMPPCRVCTPCP